MRYLLALLLLAGCASDSGLAARQRLNALLPTCLVLCFATVHGTEAVSNSLSTPAAGEP